MPPSSFKRQKRQNSNVGPLKMGDMLLACPEKGLSRGLPPHTGQDRVQLGLHP